MNFILPSTMSPCHSLGQPPMPRDGVVRNRAFSCSHLMKPSPSKISRKARPPRIMQHNSYDANRLAAAFASYQQSSPFLPSNAATSYLDAMASTCVSQQPLPGWCTPTFDSQSPFAQSIWLPSPVQSQHTPGPLRTPITPFGVSGLPIGLISPVSQTESEMHRPHLPTQGLGPRPTLSIGIPSPEASPRSVIHQHQQGQQPPSPGNADLNLYGFMNPEGTWSCAYPGCTSRAVFTRGCDLRKHHKRHTKSFFCRYPGCSQATGGGFSSKKDLARHEAKHNPGVVCEWSGCDRVFSRVDNMVSFSQ
jgi:hypothetical protein